MQRGMNAKVVLLLVGLVIGAAAGWLTRPEVARIELGPLKLEVQGEGVGRGSELTGGQVQHIAILAILGAVIGFGAGYVMDRRKPG